MLTVRQVDAGEDIIGTTGSLKTIHRKCWVIGEVRTTYSGAVRFQQCIPETYEKEHDAKRQLGIMTHR